MPARPVPTYGALPERDALIGGRYRLEGPIGSGGTADVFRGTDQVLGREVAVKVFRAGTDTVTADRFCDEARVLARLSHPALVTVYDAGRHGQGAFMVTELIRGATLRARVDDGPLSPVRVARIGADISSALDHVHDHGLIHHDVKPSNVLLGEDGSPHLADFGLSRTVHEHSISAPDTLVGTVAYMAPEQLLGHGASKASDIYALGLTLLEALTGHREYGGTPVEIGTDRLLHAPGIPEGLPDDLARLLKAMTARDPAVRPDAAAVHQRLEDIAHAPRSRTERSAPATDTSTHRSPWRPLAAEGRRAEPARTPGPAHRRAARRRRGARLGLVAVGVAGACTLVMGRIPAGENGTPAPVPVQEQPAASDNTAPAGPRPVSPAPLPLATPSAAPGLQASTREPQPGGERLPANVPGAAKTKDTPGKAKGKKNKGR
ncbi:protein kinase [Streptomyces sp. ISL-66]|uniref:serine/threonine-protein kinase n=1 Tax=Streptomyces sp. ISL-66 TaxID=2819186 RepID=UPI001BE4F531|nr:serine/threonine-protein kinase [Streptomyces sp. ISL-66]MBT2468991.1 protein kinase [Streptomyces sp. ISL-66]